MDLKVWELLNNIMDSQAAIYTILLDKLEKIRNNVSKIKDYTVNNETNNLEYLEKLKNFSLEINNIESISEDMVDIYIMKANHNILSNEDLNLQKNLLINKKIQDTFMPYMLYMQIILQNK
jgi:hypothetical protein